MGRHDNRRTPKTLRRKAWRRKKLRLKAKIEAAKTPQSKK